MKKLNDETTRNIKKFIEGVYNEKRIHSFIGYLTPNEFERGIILNRTTTKVA